MRKYETAFLISPKLSEEETEKIISQMADVISRNKGKMIKEDRWGKRKLAYQIEKYDEAFYVFFHYEGNRDIPFELERLFKQTEAIIRFLTVKKETELKDRGKKKSPLKVKEVQPEKEDEKTETEEMEEEAPIFSEESEKEINNGKRAKG